jgi:nucleotide-binding universal stress UspA family protein
MTVETWESSVRGGEQRVSAFGRPVAGRWSQLQASNCRAERSRSLRLEDSADGRRASGIVIGPVSWRIGNLAGIIACLREVSRKPEPSGPPPLPDRKIRRILAAMDFSPCSAEVISQAGALALSCGSSVTVLHVVAWMADGRAGPGNIGADARKYRLAGLGDAALHLARQGVEVQSLMLEGCPVERITALTGYDLIVIGRRTKTAAARTSSRTLEGVLSGARCPVLVVCEPPRAVGLPVEIG